jgi:hypothetical protein
LQAAAGSGASLDRLVKAWGLTFDVGKVATDKTYFTELGGEGGRPQANPSFLQIPPEAMDTNDVVTSQIARLYLPFSGVFSGSPAEGLKQTVLIRTSPNSDLTEKMLAQFGGSQDFKASGKEHTLAVRLAGKFKTAFPDGKPKSTPEEKKEEGTEKKAEPEVKPADDSLKTSKEDNVVVLVGDSDLLHEQFYARVQNFSASAS